jgi:small-conductance mechanosensitive channel
VTLPSWLALPLEWEWVALAAPWLLALVGCAAALVMAQWSWRLLGRVLRDRASAQLVMLVQRAVWWGIVGVALSTALRTLGFDLSLFLGAAGIVTVSVGFASQTAASNLISGLFLVAERPFVVGDLITVGDTTGEVVTVDLLSVKLRTFDNRLVRIPNELLLKVQLANLTHFAIRRVDLVFVVPYDADPDEVRSVAYRIADETTGVLDEPRPMVLFEDFVLEGASFQVSAWTRREDYYETRNRLARDLLVGFRNAGLLFAAPVRVAVRSP